MPARWLTAVVVAGGLTAWTFGQSLTPGRLAGRVVDDVGVPVAGATVTVTNVETGGPVEMVSDADGVFAGADLRPGRYDVTAERDGYVRATYGAADLGQGGTAVRLDAGAAVEDLTVVLHRFGSISGTLYDEKGEPAALSVSASRLGEAWTADPPRHVGSAQSTEDGTYRIDDLVPGRYVVRAQPDLRAWAGEISMTQVPLRTFYGGAVTIADASPIVVVPGAEAAGIDIRIASRPGSWIEFDVRSPGRPIQEVVAFVDPVDLPELGVRQSRIRLNDDGGELSMSSSTGTLPLFVPPGRYQVYASARVDGATWWAETPATSDGQTNLRVVLSFSPPARLSGRVDFDPVPSDRTYPGIVARPLTADGSRRTAARTVAFPLATGEFELNDLRAGRYVLETEATSALNQRWSMASLTINGRDVLDLPFDLVPGQEARDVVLTLSSRHSLLRGQVLDKDDRPATSVTLAVFPSDSRYWWERSRRIRVARPDTAGRFTVGGLPAGKYLVSIVPRDLLPTQGYPQFLGALASTGHPVTVVSDTASDTVVRVR